ncbi:MAG: BamA/TamA family outer membrane protein [Bacteroidetes bacterium]|nr:BamA/TamA family outer membrane protein [Bacteroidota bacterium]
MKYFFHFILYLNIYTISSITLVAQELQLEVTAESPEISHLIDSLQITTTHPNFASLKTEVDSLLPTFQKLGYLESRLDDLIKKNDSTYTSHFVLGNQWKYIIVSYSKNDFSKEEIRFISETATDSTFLLRIIDTEKALRHLNELTIEKGNPFAKLHLIDLQQKNNILISGRLEQNNGSTRTIDNIIIKGYEKFPISFLKHYAGIKPYTSFNRNDIINKNTLLNNLGFASSIKTPEVLFKKDSTTLYLYLEKSNNNLFDGIIGFATNEETQKLEFNGYLNLELNNNLNFGEQLRINYKADGREQLNFSANVKLPYLFKSPFGLSAALKIFKRDSTFTTTDQQIATTYQPSPKIETQLGYKTYESSNLLEEAVAGIAVEDYNSNYFLLGATYTQQQNNPLFPVKTLISVNSEIGTRNMDQNKDDQFRIKTHLHHTINLNHRNSIFIQNQSGLLSSDTYLTNELYRFGGINSIRGFSENSIDASTFTVLNTEYRYIFNNDTYLHSIIDLAYFENNVLSLKEELFSFGLGLGLQTEAGIFKFNIANGISQEQNFKFSNTKIHLSLSSRF